MIKLKSGLLAIALIVAVAFPAGALAATDVPLRGWDSGHFEVPGPCAGGVQVVIGGAGNAAHLGRYAYTAVECFDPAAGTFAGSAKMIAADGSSLSGTYSGHVAATDDPDVIIYDEVLTITGGSKRLADVAGQVHIIGWANLATGAYGQTLDGRVTRPGS